MKWRYLVISEYSIWGKTEETMNKAYFTAAVQRGDKIIDLAESKFFNKEINQWEELKGDD